MSFPRYPTYKDSGVEWLGEVPEHWEITRLGFESWVRARLGWKGLKAEEYVDAGYAFLSTPNIKGREIDFKDVNYINKARYDESPEIRLTCGDVLLAKDGSLGICNVLRSLPCPATVNSSIAVITPSERLNSIYLHYLLCGNGMQQLIQQKKGGMGVPHLFQADLVKFAIPLPTPSEQASITTFLDRETAKIDALIAEQQRLIELLQEKRQAVISHAVTKGLNPEAPMKDSGVEWLAEVPEHWEVAQLNQLINKITNGYVGPTRDILQDEGTRYLQSLHIKNNKILFETPYYVSEEWSAAKEKSILKEGDVLIVQTGDIGQSAVVSKEYEGSNCHALIVVSPRSNVLTGAWLSWVLNSTFGKETLLSIQTGALHPHLNCGNVKFISIPVPPLGEQAAICDYIATKNLEADELIDASCKSIELMRERRSALISAAVTGQIDVRGMVPKASAA